MSQTIYEPHKSVDMKAKVHIALFGISGVGKTTIFSHWFLLTQDEGEISKYKSKHVSIIYSNIIETTQKVTNAVLYRKLFESKKAISYARTMKSLNASANNSEKIYRKNVIIQAIETLWLEDKVKEFYLNMRSADQIPPSADHFFMNTNLKALRPLYEPSTMDIVHCWSETTAVKNFTVYWPKFDVVIHDYGGSRAQQRTWKNADVIIYVVSLINFDETDSFENSLSTFGQIFGDFRYDNVPFILVFNKADLLKDKLNKKKFNEYVRKYKGTNDFTSVCEYVKNEYLEKCRNTKAVKHRMKVVISEAIDEESVKRTINSIQRFLEGN